MSGGNLPSKQDIRRFIDESGGTAGKREVARNWGIKGQDRIWLKRVIREIEAERALETKQEGRPPGRLPPVTVINVVEVGEGDGDLICRPASWDKDAEAPRIVLDPDSVRGRAPRVGDQFLARMLRRRGWYEARAMKRLELTPRRTVGVLSMTGPEGRVTPANRKLRHDIHVGPADLNGAKTGDLVVVETQPGRAMGPRYGRITEVLGSFDSPRAISVLAIQTHEIPDDFGAAALNEAEAAAPVTEPGKRTDLRDIPFITIDPSDARDHDDAVWAEADTDPKNEGGYRLLVAIADVAHYVRPGSALDKAAQARGVSAYFPDRVAPMLPEALSADLCSLKPGEVRPVLAAEIIIDRNGRKRRHSFMRALIRSAGNFAYETVQRAIEGDADDTIRAFVDPVLKPLYGAFELLLQARNQRQTLEIDLPERRVELGDDGFIRAIAPRQRLDAHKLIEEMMILANVCAAETLERRKQICVYRIHEPPPREKLGPLKSLLESLNIPFAAGDTVAPMHFNRILAKVRGTDEEQLVSEQVLRSQDAAYYGTDNQGHFGLALRRYAHFTSPIRRYADLLVHRALIDALGAGTDGLGDATKDDIERLAEQVSAFERRAMLAERDALDRFTAIFLKDQVGGQFAARATGFARAGMFVTLNETGASGLVPMRLMGSDYYDYDDEKMVLTGRATGVSYRLGTPVAVRLVEALPVTGGLTFELLQAPVPKSKPARGRPKNLPKRGGKPSMRRKGKRR